VLRQYLFFRGIFWFAVCVPRKLPLPQREIEIGRRLNQARRELACPRRYLARSTGVDSSVIKRVEIGRVALKYGLAQEVLSFFNISALWLATGQGEMMPSVPLPAAADIGVSEGATFGQVFDDYLAPHLRPPLATEVRSGELFIPGFEVDVARSVKMDWVRVHFQDWFDELPDAALDKFYQEVLRHGKSLASKLGRDHWAKILKRRRDRAALKALRESQGSTAARPKPPESKTKCKLPVDKPGRPATIGRVKSGIGSWNSLLAELKALTVEPGSKANLARRFGVSRQAVNKWLSNESSPTADMTLRLLEWVQGEEAKQKRSPGRAVTRPEPKAQFSQSKYEKPKPGRPKACRK